MTVIPSIAPTVRPAATQSLHGDFLEQSIPQWLTDASTQRRQAFKDIHTTLPPWYRNAAPDQREALNVSFVASLEAQNRLDQSMATFQDVEAFARPLLIKALKDRFQLQVDVDKILLCLRRPLEISIFEIELSSFEVLKLSMLDAALHNFEDYECKPGAYHKTSGFVKQTATTDTYEAVPVNLSVSQFLTLCRSLDIGKQYQAYLKGFFYPAATTAPTALREPFIASQKAALRAAAELALLKKDIEPADYTMIVSVINGERHPWMGRKQVWFEDLGLMRKRMTGCVAFSICEKYRYSDEVILYVPNDPEHPLKRYSGAQMKQEFKSLFTAGSAAVTGAEPTPYQRFFSQFVPYDQRPYYFSQFTQKAADSPSDPWRSPWRTIVNAFTHTAAFTHIRELPPERPAKLAPAADPYLAPSTLTRKGRGIWAENEDLWEYLYQQHCAKVLADARSHAVPTQEVDAKAREAKLAHLMEVGLLGLNLVSMFVPVLGEVMMVVMAGQLLYETLEGAVEWGEGDRRAAKDHLVDVAENLVQIALMAGVGAGVRKFQAAEAPAVLEDLRPVTLPNGKTRLWKPDLRAYASPVALEASGGPNLSGQHRVDGTTYMRQGGQAYQQFFDESLGKWRIRHPSDPDAYQPLLEHNGRGAWRHTLERPLQWDRLTLLRRMGHAAEEFSDAQLLKVADISGVSDNALRKMHLDNAPPPPELQDAMRLFRADADSARVIAQLRGSQAVDSLYLYALPLVTEMPRWPASRVLQVFDGDRLTGESLTYGASPKIRGAVVRAPIRVSRADILRGDLTARILAQLDEPEIIRLLGEGGARLRYARAEEFSQQIADYARTRQPAIFDSIYRGTSPADARVRLLRRTCPGLGDAAAEEILAHARPEEIERLNANRGVPLRLLEEARWFQQQGRQTRAYAGLRSENIATADSRRLALHTLQNLPGWPDTVRLEVREGSQRGALLDSVGSESAHDKKYLVKKGQRFQAFDERGEALNSQPDAGDNFYVSIMHALPDDARRSLAVPEVSQSAELRRRIIEHAVQHRTEAVTLLEPQAAWFKPPTRINERLLGYYASGRGPGLNPHLTVRVRDVYPQLTDQQANGFVLRQLQAGKTDKDIFNLLQHRQRDWDGLNAALDRWLGPAPEQPLRDAPARSDAQATYERKTLTAQALKACWRQAPLAAELPGADRLVISSLEPLPGLTTDFSHIRELSVGGRGLTDANADDFLARFPDVEKLSLGERGNFLDTYTAGAQPLTTVPHSLSAMRSLKNLRFRSHAFKLAADFPTRLQGLTSLETLHIECEGVDPAAMHNLDLAPLTQLKSLTIDAPAMTQWPAFAQHLPQLERLDLANTSINVIPQALYSGHEKLWAGLSLDWSKFTHEAFKPAYEYVRNYAGPLGHLVDLPLMVRGFCYGELAFLTGEPGVINPLPERILTLWDTPATRLAAVEALRAEHAGIFRQFYEPGTSAELRTARRALRWTEEPNASVLRALEINWRAVVRARYGLNEKVTLFELPASGAQMSQLLGYEKISELPPLPAGIFADVTTLRLGWLDAPVEQVRGFIRAFGGTQTLEISGNGLSELPIGPGDLPQLSRLDISYNSVVVTPHVQSQFSRMSSLEYLNASQNPLTALDVSALTKLKALNLRATELEAWPAGAEHLPQLDWADLRDNAIESLPPAVLADDEALLKTSLTGNAFSPEGQAALNAAQQRVENVRGLPVGALQRFALEPVPADFPPGETARSIVEYLLPLPRRANTGTQASGFAERLQNLNPVISPAEAEQCISRLRSAGMSDDQISNRLGEWQQTNESLTRQLNGWIFTRETRSPHAVVSADGRGFAALSIRECWQDGVTALTPDAGQELSLMGPRTGDLPSLTAEFDHVRTLNLTGSRITAQGSNGFLQAFPQLSTLVLNGNELSALPQAVLSMSRLQRLELNGNQFADAQSLYRLPGRDQLRWLDVGHNHLNQFDARTFNRLETLNLAYNGLVRWPEGTLEAPNLRTLNLSGNDFRVIPDRLLDGTHEPLVGGTQLADTYQLSLMSLEQMRNYSAAHGDVAVMGISRQELDLRISAIISDSDSDFDSDIDSPGDSDSDGDDTHANVQPIETLLNPSFEVSDSALQPWLVDTRAEVRSGRTSLWVQLAQEDDRQAFFHLLSTLRDTSDFRLSRADLTHRVWRVIQAATENTELRQLLFINAETHGACSDGRILSFSELESRVYEYNALRDIPRQRPEQRGRALLDLSRRLFRLGRVDRLAERAGRGQDRAEVRLEYRIGMTSGWPDGLELPGQPEHMMFGRPIRGQQLARARASVLADEASDVFIEDLISRDYWERYLRERHPDAFDAVERNASKRQDEVEDAHPDRTEGPALEQYTKALHELEVELASARTANLMELSRAEMQALASIGDAVPPTPPSPQPGPSHRQ
ncbi:hypothetical protein PHLH6_33130 [Pseudomonas sp. Seg1]|uniref:NEL-type E3 ubiquitin ligase domain-containing protein n=1 Tax=Pseudomonas sp. Seg1 TaxID=2678259 RepID=UPI001BB36312|nr:NEL-type E3 ubiquitin ligase domain-containing protein [Pseudomonas sp. Seg1]BBP71309.1 hypothetical protein PHLH6_33130 [Pseudomonas sp. Seg1]